MEKYMVSVDWLELYCKYTSDECFSNVDTVRQKTNGEYVLIDKAQQTSTFLNSYKLIKKIDGQFFEVASMLVHPRLTTISHKAVCIKLHNRMLYSQKYIELLYTITNLLNLEIVGITRLDLCYDCNKFHGGRNPHRFIKQFLTADYNSERFLYKKGTNRFAAYGKKTSNSEYRMNGLEFGSGKSNFRSYIYNKTLELKEEKDKPWIRESWEANGLISNEKTPVWRSEISIKAKGMDILNMGTGQLFKLSPDFLISQKAIERLFYIYADKALSFSIRKKAKAVRDFTPVQIFECAQDITSKPYNVCRYKDSGRAEMLAAKTLYKISETYSNIAEFYDKSLRDAMAFLSTVSGRKEELLHLKEAIERSRNTQNKELMDSLGIDYLAMCEAMGIYYERNTNIIYDTKGEAVDVLTEGIANNDSLEIYFMMQEYREHHDKRFGITETEAIDRDLPPTEAQESVTQRFRKKIKASNIYNVQEIQ